MKKTEKLRDMDMFMENGDNVRGQKTSAMKGAMAKRARDGGEGFLLEG